MITLVMITLSVVESLLHEELCPQTCVAERASLGLPLITFSCCVIVLVWLLSASVEQFCVVPEHVICSD